jgi:hypothetical protein
LRRGGSVQDKMHSLPTQLTVTKAKVRRAQLVLDYVATHHPNLGCVEEREAELEEVLQALGICNRKCVIEMKSARVMPGGHRMRSDKEME